ncbi:hypothetical protein [Streptomyces sp. NPDC017260]|uniref:hypothetical protein n=1 Tax=unclassified Streptomyces TaxID=2593676 RepID=UPI0037B26311
MNRLPPHTFATFCRGMDTGLLQRILADSGRPARAVGDGGGWGWVLQDAVAAPNGQGPEELARDITGYRFVELVGRGAETVFLASTPACECPHGQDYLVPHCPRHPFQFAYHRGGFEQSYFNLGARRESRRGGAMPDLLLRELLAAGVVGRETPEPGFNEDGAVTMELIARHFGLPTPPSQERRGTEDR